MVTICAKKFCKPTIQDIMLSKIRKKKEDEGIEEFFQKLKQQRQQGSPRVLSGTSVPNSTFKSLINAEKAQDKDNSAVSVKDNSTRGNDKIKSSSSITSKQSITSSIKSLKRNVEEKKSPATLIKPEEKSRTSSLLSGTSTLEELKELKNLLQKSSYVPKQIRTRRPTIEKIKSAIEREKQSLSGKNASTTNDSVELSDASTSTENKKKKLVKRTKKASSSRMPSNTSRSINTQSSTVQGVKKGTKPKRKKKISSKIDVEVQCSIFKVKTNEGKNSVQSQIDLG